MKLRIICLKISVIFILLSYLPTYYCFAAQQAVNDKNGTSASTNTPDTQPPSPPGSISAVNRTQTSISLEWSKSVDNVGVKGYQLYRDGKKIVTTSRNTYTNRDLIPGKEYTYSVKAYDARGNVSESSETLCISALPDYQPPTVPGSPLASSIAYTSITLNWKPSSDNTGIKGYEIFVCGARKASTSKTSYTCKGLSPGSSYDFAIKAVDMAGNYSPASGILYTGTMADMSAPSAPFGLKSVSVSETEVSLSWSPSSDNVKVSKYEIYCDGKQVGTTSKTTYTCKKLVPGTNLNYTLMAVDSSNLRSSASKCLAVSTLKDLKPPAPPESLRISSENGSSVSFSWKASTDNVKVKGYNIYCNGSIVATTARTSRSVKNPSSLGVGIYWVRAFDQSGNLSEKSNIVMAITKK